MVRILFFSLTKVFPLAQVTPMPRLKPSSSSNDRNQNEAAQRVAFRFTLVPPVRDRTGTAADSTRRFFI